MNKRRNYKPQLKTTILLLIILITSIISLNPLKIGDFNSHSDSNKNSNDIDLEIYDNSNEDLKSSIVSQTKWWNSSFRYRTLINISNPYTEDLTNHPSNFTFNYNDLVVAGKMQATLADIRIVENGIVRDYFVVKDDPKINYANVFFVVNVSASTTDYDTFMYYGNSTVGKDSTHYMDEKFGKAWYRFEEGTGPITKDSSGNNNDGTINGATWETDAKVEEYCLEFSGSNTYVEIPASSTLSMSEGVSISMWVYLTAGSQTAIRKNGRDYLFEFGTNGNNNPGSNPQYYVRTSGGRTYVYGTGAYSALSYNTWYHCVGTYYYTTGSKMYIDSVEATVVSQTQLGTVYDQNSYLRIGGWSSENYYGRIDDVRIFDYSLSQDDVDFLYKFDRLLNGSINEEQEKKAEIKVIAKDLHGNLIQNGNISIYNKTADPINPLDSDITDSDGSVTFEELDIGSYNFSVSLTSNIIDHTVIVNETSNPFLIDGIISEITLICNVSSHNFKVYDADGEPVESGFIIVGNSTPGFGQIRNCTINQNGRALFQWVNVTPYEYNYTVKYQNSNYFDNIVTLATGSTNTENETITVITELTTVTFTLIEDGGTDFIPGAKLNLTRFGTFESIVNLTTDQNGVATLRWLNSSGLGSDYNLRIFFWQDVAFNTSTGGASTFYTWRFTVSYKKSYILEVAIDPDDYITELISLNPTDDIKIKWSSQLTLRYLLNVTQAGDPSDPNLEGPTYADSMTYEVLKGQNVLLSGTIPKEIGYEGIHKKTFDTSPLESGESYTIIISAQRSGFTTPSDKSLNLFLKKYDIQLNQSANDDSTQTIYWLEKVNMSVTPYGINSESFVIEDSLFKEPDNNNYNLDFWIPDLSTEWNLSQIEFDIYNVTFNVVENDININFTDDYGITHTFDKNNADYNYYQQGAPNGTWNNLVINLNKKSKTYNNTFSFTIEGTFDDNIDIIAIATFRRDKINVEYRRFNVTNDIVISADGNGWAIKNITFLLSNCYNTSTWTLINPADEIVNITTNDGRAYNFVNGAADGTGNLTISDYVYPIDNQFLFYVYNTSNIIYDLIIKIEYIQEFYWNKFLEINNISKTQENVGNLETFRVNFNGYTWTDQGILVYIDNLKNGTGQDISPTEAGLNFTVDLITFYFDDYGTFLLTGISKNQLLQAIIRANQKVFFDLNFITSSLRTVYYEIMGSVSYQIRQAPEVFGDVSYNEELELYRVEIDSSVIDADTYTVRFTTTKDHYNSGTKDLDLEVLERITLLNGNERKLTNIITQIYIKDTYNFTFSYLDRDLNLPVLNLDTQSWIWWSGNIEKESGELVPNAQNQYVFDFDTETRSVGTYSITIELAKDNYQAKIISITLIVDLRYIESELGDEFDDKKASVVKGETLKITLELTDPTKGGAPLTGAYVVLEIGDDELEFDEVEPGVYELEFDTDDYEAFFSSNTLTGTIKITKADYLSDEIDITIVVEMEEIMPGIPTFYFIIVVSAIAAVIGALVGYRVIQQARIPKFVKKVRKMKKVINSKRSITESLLYPSKESFAVRELGHKFKILGLSYSEILGIPSRKEELISETEKINKIEGSDL